MGKARNQAIQSSQWEHRELQRWKWICFGLCLVVYGHQGTDVRVGG